ncbi:uncharacterized protein PV07_08152 [Cladophialophora immunda]|uniref:DNA replication regulator SLD2 n=1 Tax=Cladophialophora immunda TaxID=569365 RepID=A0A0D2CBS2_9EURO|nr:uncharacterized protein PV07_08152 [Cladophialophora immunda]KIW28493.1 hypothetical protein PV07_08152 [Cladophialophora immunda]OQU95085.1 hypothetical protein CLAIMM_01342 [Cladophialophora immunda]
MDTSTPLLDTPKRASLQSQADALRVDLKEYERTFAARNGGRKPGKGDIKADAVIAARYKEYNRVRDVLAGKRGIDALNTPRLHQNTRRHGRSDSAISLTPHRGRKSFSPSRSLWHPNDIDPYDPPLSISPKVIPKAIGPTPRRDGTVLGIFDLLPNSGSKKSVESTPGSRKRKIDALFDGPGEDGSRQLPAAQTPSQKPRKARDNGHLGLQATTPSTRLSAAQRLHSKTPISEGKKFMLDHFFATPSAVRFATMISGDDDTNPPIQSKTPLRDFVLKVSPAKDTETGNGGHAAANGNDSTPPYLKRSFSFKERLFAASGASAGKSSPTSTRTGPRRSLGYGRCAPKPLSQIIADLEQSKQEDQQRNDEDNEDDLDALREMEANEINVLVNDSQRVVGILTVDATEEAPAPKVWKKKGQKRTTRRVIMRPVKMKPAAAPKFVADDEDEDEDEARGIDEIQESEDELALALEDAGVDLEASEKETLTAENEQSGDDALHDPDASDEADEYIPRTERPANRRKATSKSKSSLSATRLESQSPASNPDEPLTGTRAKTNLKSKASRKPTTSSKGQDEKTTTTTTTRKINPNAYAHMNFRSLKIKNKNSRAKRVGGRFSRGRR